MSKEKEIAVMARGVRKTALEKLQSELEETQSSIEQYIRNLEILREKEVSLLEQIELEEFKSFKAIMDKSGLTLNDVKELICLQNKTRQSA